MAAVLPIANTAISAYFLLGGIWRFRRISTGTTAHAPSVMVVMIVTAYEMGISPGTVHVPTSGFQRIEMGRHDVTCQTTPPMFATMDMATQP